MLPNFLIVGQAKCGTSSLAQYLKQHPQIYISSRKEPRYFTSQPALLPLGGPLDHEVEEWYVKSFDEYQELFSEVTTEKAVGEASADTMYFHQHTIPLIKKKLGDPKIIIILRDPVKRAFSAWKHLIRDTREDLSFREGIAAEAERIAKNYELIYHYTSVSRYAKGVQAFINNFSQVKVILNEDLAKNPERTLQQVAKFLEVDTSFTFNTKERYNMSGMPKSKTLQNVMKENSLARKVIRPVARLVLPKKARIQLTKKITDSNLKPLHLSEEDDQWLRPKFIYDIERLEELLNLDLHQWKSSTSSTVHC